MLFPMARANNQTVPSQSQRAMTLPARRARHAAGRMVLWAVMIGAAIASRCTRDSGGARPPVRISQVAAAGGTPLPKTGTGAEIESAATVPEDGQWVRPVQDYANSRYSGLGEITAANVRALRPAFTFSMGVLRGQEAASLVVGNTMHVVSPFPKILYALRERGNGER